MQQATGARGPCVTVATACSSSAKVFAQAARLIEAGFDVITYRKGKAKPLPAGQFSVQRRKIDGVWCDSTLCDRTRVRVGTLPA